MKQIVCYGEVLWDMLPDGKVAGGAPMNVAFQAGNLGLDASMISRVGEDELGEELLEFLRQNDMQTDLVQIDPSEKTGQVAVQISAEGQPTYDIIYPVAWDFIEPGPTLFKAVREAEIIVFGSLAARSPVSRETLFQLLAEASFRAFDVNLRPPHYQRDLLETLLQQSELIKLNHEELSVLSEWFGLGRAPASQLENLKEKFGAEAVICTLGKKGAWLLDGSGFHRQPGFPVQVKDTIGSGDAFFATFLWSMLSGDQTAQSLKKATAAGGLVAARQGATFPLSPGKIEAFIREQES